MNVDPSISTSHLLPTLPPPPPDQVAEELIVAIRDVSFAPSHSLALPWARLFKAFPPRITIELPLSSLFSFQFFALPPAETLSFFY